MKRRTITRLIIAIELLICAAFPVLLRQSAQASGGPVARPVCSDEMKAGTVE